MTRSTAAAMRTGSSGGIKQRTLAVPQHGEQTRIDLSPGARLCADDGQPVRQRGHQAAVAQRRALAIGQDRTVGGEQVRRHLVARSKTGPLHPVGDTQVNGEPLDVLQVGLIGRIAGADFAAHHQQARRPPGTHQLGEGTHQRLSALARVEKAEVRQQPRVRAGAPLGTLALPVIIGRRLALDVAADRDRMQLLRQSHLGQSAPSRPDW